MKAIIGRKAGMTQVFAQDGTLIPVTVVEVLPNYVLQKKTVEKDGYAALQVGYEESRENLLNKPKAGHFKKANVSAKKFVREIKGSDLEKYEVGDTLTVDIFKAGDVVDVIGVTKGKGFQGVIKRYNFSKGPSSHGSGYHRGLGSLATSGLTNNRIHPGRKMAGRMGHIQQTTLNLDVVAVDVERNAILIKGAVPGPKRGVVTIRSAIKTQKNTPAPKVLVDYSEVNAE